MSCTPSAWYCGRFSEALPGRIAPLACQTPTGATLGIWNPPTRHPHKIRTPSLSALHAPPLPAVSHCLFPVFSSPPYAPFRCFHCCCPPPARSATMDSYWRNNVSTITLNKVGNSGLPYVTPLSPHKGSLYYPPARSTILSCSQNLRRKRRSLGPTSYPSSISRNLDLSKSPYAFCSSRKIL